IIFFFKQNTAYDIIRTNDDRVLTYWSHLTTLRRTRLAHNLNKLFCPLGNQRTLPFADRLDIDEVSTDTERCGASTNKVCGSLERDAASRHELNLRQRRLQGFQITRPTNRARGKHLHKIRAGIP